MIDEAERGTSGDGKKERNSWPRCAKKPPVNLWMLIHSRSASRDCKRVNAAEAWTCERRHIAPRTTTTRPAFQTQHCRWWWISHMYAHLLYRKHTHTVLAVASRIFSITVVKARAHTHSYVLPLQTLSTHTFTWMHTPDTFIIRKPVC